MSCDTAGNANHFRAGRRKRGCIEGVLKNP